MKQKLLLALLGLFLIVVGIYLYSLFNSSSKQDNGTISKTDKIVQKELSKQDRDNAEKERIQNIAYINEAGIKGNLSVCEKISNETQKQECIDNGNLAKAGIENNINYCSLVKNTESKSRCIDDFYYNNANSKKDLAMCSKIKNTLFKDKCSSNIILARIESNSFSGTIDICNSIKGDEKKYCINRIQNDINIDILQK